MIKSYNPPEVRINIPSNITLNETREPQRITVDSECQPWLDVEPLPSFAYETMENAIPPPPRRTSLKLDRGKVVFQLFAVEKEVWNEENRTENPSQIYGYKMYIAQNLYLPKELRDKTFNISLEIFTNN